MSEVFREIDEEIRREQYLKLWQRHGKYIVAVLVVLLVAVGGFFGWREYRNRQADADAARFATALELVREDKQQEAMQAFANLAEDGNAGYRALSGFQIAAARLRGNDVSGAVTAYEQIAADSGISSVQRDLARLLAASALVDGAPAADIEQRLQPLLNDSHSLRHSARELVAAAKLKAGDVAAAREGFQQLADDATAPAGTRARAAELLAALGPG